MAFPSWYKGKAYLLRVIGFATASAPAVSATGEARVYFDTTTKQLMISRNGGAYVPLGEEVVVSADIDVTVAATDTEYNALLTLPTAMASLNWRVINIECDQAAAGAHIRENPVNKTTTTTNLLITVPTGAAAGTYGDNKHLRLKVHVAGPYTGATLTGVAMTIGTPA